MLKELKSNLILPLITLTLLILLPSGCATARYKSEGTAVFPLSGPDVPDQLMSNCPPDKCPAVWEWVHRLAILKDQMEVK